MRRGVCLGLYDFISDPCAGDLRSGVYVDHYVVQPQGLLILTRRVFTYFCLHLHADTLCGQGPV